MDIEKYKAESAKTLAATFQYEDSKESELKIVIRDFIAAATKLDLLKKKKFYGKDVGDLTIFPCEKVDYPGDFKRDEDGAENLLHAAIGIATESGEIIEAVMDYKYKGVELDRTNIKEELGDIFWYFAIFLRDLDLDLEDILQVNIDKLRARYGEKFSSDKAINRDLDTERNILEK